MARRTRSPVLMPFAVLGDACATIQCLRQNISNNKIGRFLSRQASAAIAGIALSMSSCMAAEPPANDLKAEYSRVLSAHTLQIDKRFDSTEAQDRYCSVLLDELKSKSKSIEFVQPRLKADRFDETFRSVQSRCPSMPLNEFSEYDLHLDRSAIEELSKEEKRMLGRFWLGTKNPKYYEIPLTGDAALKVFYAEGYFSESVAKRAIQRNGESGRKLGFARSPGNSARYTFFDLDACRELSHESVHEPIDHFTGRRLPNRSALVKRNGEVLILDLFVSEQPASGYSLVVSTYSNARNRVVSGTCRFSEAR